jgi:hypothetical protein
LFPRILPEQYGYLKVPALGSWLSFSGLFCFFRDYPFLKNAGDLFPEPGEIFVCGIPDLVHVDAKILVDEKMAHGNDIFPGNFRVLFLEFRRDPVCRFPDYLDMVKDPHLEQVGFDELLFFQGEFFRNTLDCFIDIKEPIPVSSYKGTASCITE